MTNSSVTTWLVVAAVGLVAIVGSDLAERSHHFLRAADAGDVWLWFLLLGALLALWLAPNPDGRAPWMLLAIQGILVATYLGTTGGEIPTRDDHPSFLYRFHLLFEQFPHLLFYNPEWNGGYLATELPSTGALAPFLVGWPLLAAGPLEDSFAFLVPYLFVALVPWMIFCAARLHGAGTAAATVGAVLATVPTTVIFLYTLRYGVYSFVLAAGVAPLAASLFAHLFLDGRGGWPKAVALVVSTSLCLFWPLGALMLAPVLVAAPIALLRSGRREWTLALVCAAALLAIHVPWVHGLTYYEDPFRFVADQESALFEGRFSWGGVLEPLVRFVEELHPVSLVFLVPGLLWARHRSLLTGLFFWNLALATVGDQVKADVALERFSVSAAFFAAVPASLAVDRLLETPPSALRRAVLAVVLGVLALGTLTATRFYQNRGIYRFMVLPPELDRTVRAVDERCPSEGRVLVPGFSLHWFGGGHIAALPLLAKRSFIGNDFYHRLDHSDAVPRMFRSPDRLGEFLELYDIRCVLTWDESGRATVAATPEAEVIYAEGPYALFSVSGPGGRFLEGSGTVREAPGRIVVETDDAEVVLRYRYYEQLRTDPVVPVEGVPVADGHEFIRLHVGDEHRVTVRW